MPICTRFIYLLLPGYIASTETNEYTPDFDSNSHSSSLFSSEASPSSLAYTEETNNEKGTYKIRIKSEPVDEDVSIFKFFVNLSFCGTLTRRSAVQNTVRNGKKNTFTNHLIYIDIAGYYRTRLNL